MKRKASTQIIIVVMPPHGEDQQGPDREQVLLTAQRKTQLPERNRKLFLERFFPS
jgi:hypothetical protein